MKDREARVWDVAFLQRLGDCVQQYAGDSWQKFAVGAGIKQQTFNNIKLGREPKSGILRKISEHYGISVDWLLTGQELPRPPSTGSPNTLKAIQGIVPFQPSLAYADLRQLPEMLGITEQQLKMTVALTDEMRPQIPAGSLLVIDIEPKPPLSTGVYCIKHASGSLIFRKVMPEAGSAKFLLEGGQGKPPKEKLAAAALKKVAKGKVVWCGCRVT